MKKKIIVFTLICTLLLICSSILCVCANGITSQVTFDGNIATISGTVTAANGTTQVTLLVGEPGDIVYIDQVTSETDGSFTFKVPFSSSTPLGEYPYRIGSGARVGTYEGVIDYRGVVTYVTNQFLTADLNVSVNAYIPTVTGTISCTEGKTVIVTVTNVTDNTVIAEETITSADGEHAVSYTLPTLMSTKEYSLAVTVNDGTEQQVVLNVSIDCKVLSVEAAGTVNVSENTWLDMQVQSVGSDLINKSGTVTASKEVSLEIPNLVAYANIDVLAKGYEKLELHEDEVAFSLTADASIEDSVLTVTGRLQPAYTADLKAEVKNSENEIVAEAEFKSIMGGTYTHVFDLTDKLQTGIYTVNVYFDTDTIASDEFMVITPMAKINIEKNTNNRLYTALKKARPTLDSDSDGIITISELERITGALDLSNNAIESIEGLQACTGISELYLNDNKIANIDAIASLDNLIKLEADKNKIVTINALPLNLEFLNLSKNRIDDLSAGIFLEHLKFLFADENYLADMCFVSGMPDLECLSLENNEIEKINGIQKCTKIKRVNLSMNLIEDITLLGGLLRLEDFIIDANYISDITPLPDVWYRNVNVYANCFPLRTILDYDIVNLAY